MHASVDAAFVDIYTYQRHQLPLSVLNSGHINSHLTGARVVSEEIVVDNSQRTQVNAYLIPPSSNEFASLTLHSRATVTTHPLSNQDVVEHLGQSLVILRDSTVNRITRATHMSLWGTLGRWRIKSSMSFLFLCSGVATSTSQCLPVFTVALGECIALTIVQSHALERSSSETQMAFDGDLLCFRNLRMDEMTSIKAFDGYRGRMVFNCWGRTHTILDFV
ncbi:hypothetical protein BV22DRAFT_1133465 [Leucogyrophana mollusca]|uniref:Uncharacterized protein n=1 Tax=Leucogyrophana mollusca TaxID=85980 RepID=A0ACB8B2G6_9AGAM|nr:hypothetical protein BV22DRAFT_1133465 [Leucogyrophana mollusca]